MMKGTFPVLLLVVTVTTPCVAEDAASENVFDGHDTQWTLGLSAGCVY